MQWVPLLLGDHWQEYSVLGYLWSAAEILLVLALLANTFLFLRFAQRNHWPQQAQLVALGCIVSLGLCLLGDIVNKNFLQSYYAYDAWVKHSYLISSISFFFPGYFILLLTTISCCYRHLKLWWLLAMLAASVVIGVFAWMDLVVPDMAGTTRITTLAYSILITAVGLSGVLVWKVYRQRLIFVVTIGLALAALADALIGQFWIKTDDYYPAIRYLNWMIYFTSQAFIQFFPFRILAVENRVELPRSGSSLEAS